MRDGQRAGRTDDYADAANKRMDVHAGWRRIRRIRPPGWAAGRQSVRRPELVDGDGEPADATRTRDVQRDVQPRSGDGRRERISRTVSGRGGVQREAAHR